MLGFIRKDPTSFDLFSEIAKNLIAGSLALVTQFVVISGLLGAISVGCPELTWWLGLPTSSSHARIGGYAGAAILRRVPSHHP